MNSPDGAHPLVAALPDRTCGRFGRWISLGAPVAKFVLAVALAICEVARADTLRPRRVVSINLCADQFLLNLTAPESIASLSFVAADPTVSLVTDAAARLPLNRGSAEE